MDVNKRYEEAMAIVKEAVTADGEKKYADALRLYGSAIERFLMAMEYDKMESRQKTVKDRTETYMARAEAIKKMLDEGPTTGSGGAATAQKGDTSASDEAETAKMKGQLGGAIIAIKPNVKWDDVAGLEGAKEALKEAVILPVRFPQLFTGKRKPWKGILLYGPPGTGKSYLAKAVATEADSTFFSVSSSDLVSKWQGESERLVKQLFELSREKKPAIVFIDEIDSLAGSRGDSGESESARRIKTEFLVQMDGVSKDSDGVLVLAATNTPWEIDPAMRRRFEKRIYIPLPDAHAREHMFKVHLGDTPNSLTIDDFRDMAGLTEGFSGSDIAVVVREALMEPLRKCRTAKFFRRNAANHSLWEPVMEDPPCYACKMNLSNAPVAARTECDRCKCRRMGLFDLATNELKVPDVSGDDFRAVLSRTKATVATRELERFEQFTKEFGSDGS